MNKIAINKRIIHESHIFKRQKFWYEVYYSHDDVYGNDKYYILIGPFINGAPIHTIKLNGYSNK